MTGVLSLLVATEAFGVTLTETYLHVRTMSIQPSGTIHEVEDELTIPEGAPADASSRVSKVMHMGGTAQYPREPNNLENSYISADQKGDGTYGLGASAIVFAPMLQRAESTYARSFRNDGPTPEIFDIGFTIPRLEASVAGYPVLQDIKARASAMAFFEIRNADDRVVNEGDLFDFWLEVTKGPSAPGAMSFDAGWQWSADLDEKLHAVGGLTLDYDDESYGSLMTTSLSVPAFSAYYRFEALNPGETITFLLAGEAMLDVGGAGSEGGGQALVGDPFNVSTPQGPVFNFTYVRDDNAPTPPSAVPVPAAAWLLASGLLALFGVRRSGTG